MLELHDIKKDYFVAGETVSALKGISLKFRKSEFVSILGPSGCGKTTLLNIIGGLDKYTSGDLVIEGRSTKQYGDRDWDTYRNHSIGFIFQSYHLIPHQTILQNVELALMISGVSKQERRQRAIEALEKVGLKDKINNRPNQLSGGQAQRVAIARALINDPEIVLADEPTGALDSVTSVQIMELLKEISRDRLIIMVTHNPELAEQYSTRIVRLLDGEVVDDSKPYDGADENTAPEAEETGEGAPPDKDGAQESDGAQAVKTNKGKKKKTSMSVGMAMALSLKNLLSKSKRTAMVSVAGSIGIIGVSLVLAISAGVQGYINSMEDDMLSGNPVSVTRSTLDFSSLMDMSNTSKPKVNITKLKDKLYVQSLMETLGNISQGVTKTNEISAEYIDYVEKMDAKFTHVVQYDYGFSITNNIYTDFTVEEGKDDPASQVTSVTAIRGMYSQILSEQKDYSNFAGTVSTVATFSEIPSNYEYVLSQYDIVAVETASGVITDSKALKDISGERLKTIFNDKNSLVMVADNSMVTDLMLGQYGYLTQKEFLNYAYNAVGDDSFDESIGLVGSGLNPDGTSNGENGIPLTRFIGETSKKFTWYPNNQVYDTFYGTYYHRSYLKDNFLVMPQKVQDPDSGEEVTTYMQVPTSGSIDKATGLELGVKLILRKKSGISYSCLEPGIYYTNALTEHMLTDSRESNIVKAIKGSKNGYLDTLPYGFYYTSYGKDDDGNETRENKFASSAIYDNGGIMDMLMSGLGNNGGDKSSMLRVTADMLGGGELPTAIYFYPIDFNAKDDVTEYLDRWNDMCESGKSVVKLKDGKYTFIKEFDAETEIDGFASVKDKFEKSEWITLDDGSQVKLLGESMKITYTDTVGMIINMVNTMIQMITIALVAFTALSLVVSTVMIGIITYVSVVERVKEIGILRAVGARKKDIKRLFNAETFIIGLVAGLFGILVTYLLSLIINLIVVSIAGIWGIAALPWWQALIMICISIGLTLISGLIPASAAAMKDPVVALRTE